MFLDIVVVLTPLKPLAFAHLDCKVGQIEGKYPWRLDKYRHLRAFVRFGFLNLSHSQFATMQLSYGSLTIRKKIA